MQPQMLTSKTFSFVADIAAQNLKCLSSFLVIVSYLKVRQKSTRVELRRVAESQGQVARAKILGTKTVLIPLRKLFNVTTCGLTGKQ
jgi:hypothetical protein